VSKISTSLRSIVRTLLVVGETDASAGLLSAQAAPASDNETPTTPACNAFPRRLFFELSFERSMIRLLQRSFIGNIERVGWYHPYGHSQRFLFGEPLHKNISLRRTAT
jgi:hypothetical protein